MSEHQQSREYRRAREVFDELDIEDRAVFLLEATVTTFARGIEQAGRAVARELDNLFSRAAAWPEEEPVMADPMPEDPAPAVPRPKSKKKRTMSKLPSTPDDTI